MLYLNIIMLPGGHQMCTGRVQHYGKKGTGKEGRRRLGEKGRNKSRRNGLHICRLMDDGCWYMFCPGGGSTE